MEARQLAIGDIMAPLGPSDARMSSAKGTTLVKRLAWLVSLVVMVSIGAMAESWTGTLSDSRCAAKHAAASAADVACIKACVNKGAVPVLVTSEKVYAIASNSNDKVASHLGERVTITGKVETDRRAGDIITVESISKAE